MDKKSEFYYQLVNLTAQFHPDWVIQEVPEGILLKKPTLEVTQEQKLAAAEQEILKYNAARIYIGMGKDKMQTHLKTGK
jgi:hypothetical protein